MSQGPPENQPARTTNPSQAHQGTAVFNPQGEMSSGTVPPTSSTGAPASAQAQQRTAPLGSRTGAQPRSETSNTIPPRPITGTPALARAQQSTASSGSRTGAQPRSETSNTIPPRPRTGAQQSIATSGSRTGAQPQSETSNTIPPRPRTGTPASARAQQSTASSGSRIGAQPRSETSNTIPLRPSTDTSTLDQVQQSIASSGSRTGAQPRSETSNTIPPRPRTGTPASARAQQSTASSGSRTGAQPRSETSNTIPPRPITGAQQSIATSGSRTGAQAQSETSNTIPPKPSTGTPASSVNFAQGATSNTTPGTISPDTRLEDISSPRQPPQVPRRRVVPSTLTSRPPNRSATQATEHVSSFQRQGSEESHDDTSSESSYESVSSRAVTGIRQQMPPRSVNPSTDVGLSGTLGVTAAPPTAPSVGQPALSDQDRGHTINFRDGARSPHSMHLEDIPGVANRGFIWVANNGDQQLRVRKIQSSDESVNPNVITLEVQSVSNFRPLHFFMRLLYVYSIFQLCVFIVILTLSLLHQIGAGVILGKLTEILKIPLFIQVIHVVSHLFCIMNRVFLDIFSNFQYIRYWLPSKGTGSQHDKEVLCDRLFALTLVWCPVFTLGVNVFRGSGWSDAVSHTQLVSILGAGLICFVYFIEQIWTTWFIIRKLRKIRNGDVDGSVVRRNCCHRIRDCCHRIVNSVVLIVEQRLTYSLSSIRTEAIDSGQQSDDHVDFESFPNLVKFLYVEPDFHEITTVTEMTYAEVIPTQPRRPLTQIVDHDGRPDMVSTLSNASSLDDDDEEMANQDGRASMSNCFGFRARWISNLTIFLELVIVLCIIGSFIMLLIAMYKSLGASAASILPTVILVIATLYKLGVGDRCANLIPSNPTSGMSHLYWILCPVDTGAVVRDSGLFDIVCSEIRHRCGWRSSAATTGVRRTWMAKPKGIVIWSIFWVCILVSVGCTVAFVQMIKTEIEGEDRRNWVWLALGIGFFSFVFFVLDPEGWVYLSRREDFKDAFLKNKNNDGTQTSTTTSVPAKAHHRLEILSWMRKQRLIYALMVFVSGCYGLALYTMYENMESIDAETTNLRVQSLGAEGGREVLGYCNVQTVWNASEDVGLSLVDFGVLAALAYEPQSDDTKDVLTAWFNYSSSRVTLWESSAYPEACGRPGATTRLFDVVPSSGGPPRTVLSIRGTVDFKDWFEDIALWGPVMIADIAAQILPFGTSWESVIPEFLRATRILNAGSYANELMDCVRELKSNVTARNSRLYLTGHSLGGGLASLLGARENVPNAVFSAPGSELSIGLLAEDKLDELRRNTINVIPDGDLVPQVDRSAFHAQKIECTDESLLRPIECHGIVRTVNTLAELCGASHRLLKESEIPP